MNNDTLFVGITIDKFNGIQPSTLLNIVNKIGLEYVEITQSVFDDLEAVKKEIRQIRTGFHLPNFADFGYDLSNKRHDYRIQKLIRLINENHRALNLEYCVSHPPESKNAQYPDEATIAYLLENLQKLNTPILLENIQTWEEKTFIHFYQRAQEFLGQKLIGYCFDAPHYLLRGNNIQHIFDDFNGNIRCIHLSDFKKNYDAHLPFGKGGELPVDEILQTFKKANYEGFINLELLPRSAQDIKPLIESYLKVISTFSYRKYVMTKIRLFIFSPILRKALTKAFKNE